MIACADGYDRGFHTENRMGELMTTGEVERMLNVDNRGLFENITTLHNGCVYRLRKPVKRIRDSF